MQSFPGHADHFAHRGGIVCQKLVQIASSARHRIVNQHILPPYIAVVGGFILRLEAEVIYPSTEAKLQTKLERRHEETLGELYELDVVLIASDGLVGLPTKVNRKLAYFSWKLGEDQLRYWHFPGENVRRPIPTNWKEYGEMRAQANA